MLFAIASGVLFLTAALNIYTGITLHFDADCLYLPMLWQDLLLGRLNWFYWCTPPTNYLFPDVPLYGLAQTLVHDGVMAFILTAWVNMALIAYLGALLVRRLGEVSWAKALFAVGLALTVVSHPTLMQQGVYMGLFWPSFHACSLPLVLLGLLLLTYYRQEGRFGVWLALVCFAAGFADPITGPLLALPAAVAVLAWRYRSVWAGWGFAALLLGLSRAGSLLAEKLTCYVPQKHLDIPWYTWDYISQTLLKVSLDFWWAICHTPLLPISLILFKFVFSASFCKRKFSLKHTWWVLPIAVMLIAPALLSIGMGYFRSDGNSWRHFPFLFAFPWIIIGLWIVQRKDWVIVAASVVALLGLAGEHKATAWADVVYPATVRELDSLKATYGLQNGLSYYWEAKPVGYFSRQGLWVTSVTPSGGLRAWLENLSWVGVGKLPGPKKYYNFIITKDLNELALIQRFGIPAQMVPLKSLKEGSLWVYDHNIGKQTIDDRFRIIMLEKLRKSAYLLGY